MIAVIDQRIRRAFGSVRLAFRGVITLVKAAGQVQLVQGEGLSGEPLQDVELMQHYGFTSNPLPGTMAIVLPVGGKTSHGIVIATEHGRYRLKSLAPGEVAIYTDEGDKIVMHRGRVIDVTTQTLRINTEVMEVNASTRVDFNTPMVTASEQLTVQHNITGNGGIAITNASGTGGTASFNGNLVQTNGSISTDTDVIIDGRSQRHHRHTETGTLTQEQP